MNPIATIIKRNLLANRSVAIPSFGTLIIQWRGAEVFEGGIKLRTPLREIAVADVEAMSIIDYVVDAINVSQVEATLQYNRWLDEAIQGNYLVIEGVGAFEIAGSQINIEPGFESLMNPNPQDIVVLKRQNNAATSHRNNVATSHQNNAATSHRNNAATSHQNNVATSHRNNAATSHRNNVATSHQNNAATSHRNNAATSHRNNAAKPRSIREKKGNTFWMIIAIIAAILAALYLVYYFKEDIQRIIG